jgi:hypothetical protein
MANSLTLQTLVDGPRNAVVKVTGVLDTSDQALTTVVDNTTLFGVPPLLNIMHVDYSISDQLEVQLLWNATTDLIIMPLAGRGRMSFVDFGGLQNNAGAGRTGKIDLKTTGWASGTQIFTIILEMTKKGQLYTGVQ